MRKLLVLVLLTMSSLFGCNTGPISKVGAENAVQVIQNSESTYPGVNTSKAISGLLSILQKKGSFIDVSGWTQDYRSGGTHDVWFKVKVNDQASDFHWVITPDGTIEPANKLAQNVTARQQAKP